VNRRRRSPPSISVPASTEPAPLRRPRAAIDLGEYRDRAERRYVIEVWPARWNISRASIILGVERTNLHKKIRSYGIKRGEIG
jgi:transcriptional regulator of acetoin/glycerol metabolism